MPSKCMVAVLARAFPEAISSLSQRRIGCGLAALWNYHYDFMKNFSLRGKARRADKIYPKVIALG
ncbi:MAG: hypothetical protein DCC43_11220 [Candidatus Brocadia sp.]|nr:hypothetical protein [Candidatus Brocadia sp.]MCE7912508.1 hypothetical protein [Candidatus Brocadia sp. AMX3]RIJ96122.1 MAG: hypothetical protein DCC43_11220 [Candidatus Brocadia sp.]